MTWFFALVVASGCAFVTYGWSCLYTPAMHREFERFGLARFRTMTGVLEVLGGVGLLGGFAWPPAWPLASGGLCLLMICGVAVRLRIGDGLLPTLPAVVLMLVNGYIFVVSWPSLTR